MQKSLTEVIEIISKEKLENLYHEKGLSQTKIAKKYNVCSSTISNWMKKHSIKTNGLKKSQKRFDNEIKNLVGNEYEFLEKYKGNNKPILCKHNKCDYQWKISPNNFISRNVRCPNCGKFHKMKAEDFKNKFNEKENSKEINILSKFNGYDESITAKHICGYEWETTPHRLLYNKGCPKCAGNIKKTTEKFKKEVSKLTDDKYKVVGEYRTAKDKIAIKHISCGCIWKIKPNRFLSDGSRCQQCAHKSESYPEKRIEHLLKNNHIDYQKQYKIKGCSNKRKLPFDFAIFENGNLEKLIEYNGRQHYEPIDWFGGIKKYKTRKVNDGIKVNYCKDNNIELLVIPYWQKDNLRKILLNSI